MQVSKMDTIHQLPTSLLKEKFHQEWDRICEVLMNIYPISDESLAYMLRDLRMIHEELETRH
jgi:hypothetical protein